MMGDGEAVPDDHAAGMNIVGEIFNRCDPAATALVEGDIAVSYGFLHERVEAAASALSASQFLPRHARVGISIPNGIDHIVWSLAVLQAGGVLVPIPGELAMPERMTLAVTTALHCVISTPGQPWEAGAEAVELGGTAMLHGGFNHSALFNEAALNALNPALIRFSSGTTGRSKGVVLSHETLLARVTACNSGLSIGPGDRVLWLLPMAHHFAVSIILYLLHGATTVLAQSHLGEDLLSELAQSRATVIYASPFHHSLLASSASAGPLPHLRLAVSTAAALSASVAEKWLGVFGLPLTQGLGIIEGGLPLLNLRHAVDKPLSVGQPQAGFEVAIRDADERGIGELMLRGPGFFDAYLDPWQPRDQVLDDGWLATGDLGSVDPDGCVTLAGRLKSVINVAGLKCFPEEVEAVLNQHPGVLESRVHGRPHGEMGMIPAARIILENPAVPLHRSSLLAHCRKHLAAYKVPLEITVVEELPRTASGKLKR